jgi:hypothetical protein
MQASNQARMLDRHVQPALSRGDGNKTLVAQFKLEFLQQCTPTGCRELIRLAVVLKIA